MSVADDTRYNARDVFGVVFTPNEWNVWPLTWPRQIGHYPDCDYYRVVWIGAVRIEWRVRDWGLWK